MTIGRREFLVTMGAMAGASLVKASPAIPGAQEQNTGSNPPAQNRFKKVDEIVAAEFSKEPLGSITAGIVQGPELVWKKSYGLADIEEKRPASADRIYRIGSITKQFTAIALLQLNQKGAVHLTDPVEKYVPEIASVQGRSPWSPPITLLQLGTHTSGLDREPGDVDVYTSGAVKDWEKTLIAALGHTKYLYEPGTRQSYSNIGYAVLGLALGRAASQSYTQYVTNKIIRPLGLKDTSFELDSSLLPRLARGYETKDGKADRTVPDRELVTGRGYKVPNGALFTTIADLGKFVSFELGHGPKDLVDATLYEENQKHIYASDDGLHSGYGLGFGSSRRENIVLLGHGGSVAGYTAGAYFHKRSSSGIVFLRNSGRGLGNGALFDIAEAIIPPGLLEDQPRRS
jgi:CubicO group peptidase (beta-lactamase class C family)